jgi:uncharacterized protein YceK
MARRPLVAATLIALALALSGCATSVTVFGEDLDNLVYSGTRRDLDGWAFAHGGFLNLPFSFVFDTVLLPYTIPRTIWNYSTDDEEAEPDGGAKRMGRKADGAS